MYSFKCLLSDKVVVSLFRLVFHGTWQVCNRLAGSMMTSREYLSLLVYVRIT